MGRYTDAQIAEMYREAHDGIGIPGREEWNALIVTSILADLMEARAALASPAAPADLAGPDSEWVPLSIRGNAVAEAYHRRTVSFVAAIYDRADKAVARAEAFRLCLAGIAERECADKADQPAPCPDLWPESPDDWCAPCVARVNLRALAAPRGDGR